MPTSDNESQRTPTPTDASRAKQEEMINDLIATRRRGKPGMPERAQVLSIYTADVPAPTPQKSRPSHSNSKDNMTQTRKAIRNERIAHASMCVANNLVPDALVADAVKPRGEHSVALSERVARRVVGKLNVNPRSQEDDDSYSHWISGKSYSKEVHMYPHISSFFNFVSREIGLAHDEYAPNSSDIPRALVPFKNTDTNPVGSDDSTRIDIGLKIVRRVGGDADLSRLNPDNGPRRGRSSKRAKTNKTDKTDLSEKPNYKDVAAVIEVKPRPNQKREALEQAFIYNRNLYANQDYRRFTWGFAIYGPNVIACVFSNDNIFASKPMDVTKRYDRKELVSLLVNMAYCDEDQLGYDTSIRLGDDGFIKEIDAYNQETDTTHTYEYITMIAMATRNFGRHTRCYLCGPKPSNPDDDYVVIKDAWAHAKCSEDGSDPDDARNEIVLMRKIKDSLADKEDLKGGFSTIVHGGAVQLNKGGPAVEDNTHTAFGMLVPPLVGKPEFRVHRRLVLTPACLPLQNVHDVDQLIVAAADVMNAHTAIFKNCGILHRDISPNNMLFRRFGDNTVQGILIDFDCAKDFSIEKSERRPERTGTYPYMSINNLDPRSAVEHTQLDDWESLIYVLCWLGATGINYDDGQEHDRDASLPINYWQGDNPQDVAVHKRNHLQSELGLEMNILSRFLKPDEYSDLSTLIGMLHSSLFFNGELSFLSQGTLSITAKVLERMRLSNEGALRNAISGFIDSEDTETLDPFKRRAKHAQHIADDLHKIMMHERKRALQRIRERNKIPPPQTAVS